MNKLDKIYSLFERVCNVNGQLITESQESKSQSEAIKYIETNLGWSHEKADNFVRVDLRNDITSLRDRKIAKFTLGVTRMFCNGELNNASTISELSIIVNEMGELAFCTTRWNHTNGGSDQSMTAKEVSQVIGVNFYQVFKPNNKWNELLSEVKERLSNGEDPYYIFDWVDDFHDGFARVELNDKMNFLTTDYQLLTNQWYDSVSSFSEGFACIEIKGKGYNFINTEGQYLTNQWYDFVGYFYEGFAKVKIEGKGYNFLNREGQYLSNQWYDDANTFSEGCAKVYIEGKGWNFLNAEGQYLTNQWSNKTKRYMGRN